jgi:hypothetical protein
MYDFPIPRDVIGTRYAHSRLDLDGWMSTFGSLWERMEDRYFQFERLQTFQEPEDPSYRELVKGDMSSAVRLLDDSVARDAAFLISSCRRGIQYIRMRAVELPLTPYLEWEFKSYRVSARYGQMILVVDLTEHDRSGDFFRSHDFLLFDAATVLIHDYGQEGLLCGGWLIEDPATVGLYSDLAARLIPASVPLGVFERQLGL